MRAQTADSRGANAAEINLKAEVFTIRTDKKTKGMFAGSDGKVRDLKSGAFCAKQGGCKCKTKANLELPKIGSGIAHAGFGGDQANPHTVTYRGQSLASYCAKPSPGPAKGPGDGCRRSARQGASCPLPAPGIEVRELSEGGDIGPPVATFKRGDCTSGGDFVAIATDGDYRLEVGITDYDGFGKEYPIYNGIPDPEVIVDGPGGPYGNTQYSVPGDPFLGGISLNERGDMGLGLVPGFNADGSRGISLSGGMNCSYPDD